MSNSLRNDALKYHAEGRPGKIQVLPTKPYSTQRDLALAYSPGVAEPCLEIEKNPEDAYKYTAKGNLVAVISNGTAVLGLGDIGALAGKPVMEGKGLLFKVFADIDVFDIEVDVTDVEGFIQAVKAIAPTFGGINLEDIKAPECFEIEERLRSELNIPVMHDDQHGTAIISSAALINACEVAGKSLQDIQVVVNGAGASAVACSKLYLALGVKLENLVMCDSKGVINTKRAELSGAKKFFATTRDLVTLADALKGADVFLGLSKADVLTEDMIRTMADNPIVFALANPNPEIAYEKAIGARPDIIFATGRSDYPNQVNNVLGFPYIFRGALDVRATTINEEMKMAAAKAIASLAKQAVPDTVLSAYNDKTINFGREYLIPKPLDPRLITVVSSAVAKAAIASGVARHIITDWEDYKQTLEIRMGHDNRLLRSLVDKAKENPRRVVFAEGHSEIVLKAAQTLAADGIALPAVLGNRVEIEKLAASKSIELDRIEIVDYFADSAQDARRRYADRFYEKLQRNGITFAEAMESMYRPDYFGTMMVESGDADAFISGYYKRYAKGLKPALQAFFPHTDRYPIAGLYICMTKRGPLFFADATAMNIRPDTDMLIEVTLLAAAAVRKYGIEPHIALLSASNFGSMIDSTSVTVRKAAEKLHRDHPGLIVDGDIQAGFALHRNLRKKRFPFSKLEDMHVNILVFPTFESCNIAHKLVRDLGEIEIIGPILLGFPKPVYVTQIESSVRELVNLATIAAVDVVPEIK